MGQAWARGIGWLGGQLGAGDTFSTEVRNHWAGAGFLPLRHSHPCILPKLFYPGVCAGHMILAQHGRASPRVAPCQAQAASAPNLRLVLWRRATSVVRDELALVRFNPRAR